MELRMNKMNLEGSSLDLIEKQCFIDCYINSHWAINFSNRCCFTTKFKSSGFHSSMKALWLPMEGKLMLNRLWKWHIHHIFFFRNRKSVLNYSLNIYSFSRCYCEFIAIWRVYLSNKKILPVHFMYYYKFAPYPNSRVFLLSLYSPGLVSPCFPCVYYV